MSRTRIGGTAVLEPAGPEGEDVVTEHRRLGLRRGWRSTRPPRRPRRSTSPPPRAAALERSAPRCTSPARTTTPSCCPTAGWSPSAAASGRSAPRASARCTTTAARGRSSCATPAAGRGGSARRRPRTAATTRPRCCCPTAASSPPATTSIPTADSDTIEIYSPPYLFKGDRPVIASAPAAVGYERAFDVGSASPGVERAVLMAPSATTHGGRHDAAPRRAARWRARRRAAG